MKSKTIFRTFLAPLAALALLASCIGNDTPSPGEGPEDEPEGPEQPDYTFIFKRGDDDYFCYRIPAIVKTTEGTLLAFAEARLDNCDDEGEIDLVVKRSTDDGKTWSDMSVIWHDEGNTCGNPAPVVDQSTGRIHLLMTWNLGEDAIGDINSGRSKDTRRVYATWSDDDGLTWEEPREITDQVKDPRWGWYATGPCHGIQLAQGQYAGRLVVPCDNIELRNLGGRGYSHIIFSDDGGQTWELGGVTPQHASLNPNESTVAELSNGDLLLNCRCGENNNLRVTSRSFDGGQTLTPIETAYGFVDPVCQGSILNAVMGGEYTLFFSNPASVERTNMTIKMSTDDGSSWPRIYQVWDGPSGYSDLVQISDDKVGILYEAGETRYSEGIAFEAVDVDDFM
ncbi:MAG: glycoside hydrolase [Alistipes sp.]|nr:glycoside hydrolase [Alistipes sp.]